MIAGGIVGFATGYFFKKSSFLLICATILPLYFASNRGYFSKDFRDLELKYTNIEWTVEEYYASEFHVTKKDIKDISKSFLKTLICRIPCTLGYILGFIAFK